LATIAALTAVLSIASLCAAASAAAYVTVTAPGVTAGGTDATITFRVPDESDTARTVGLKLQLPTDHPIAGVPVAPQSGWTATISQTKLATPIHTDDGDISQVVSEIDWKAAGGVGIKPGYFGEFTIIAGKLPDNATTLAFKAIQQYSDGKEVAWIEVPAAGTSAEPEHPAPTLHLPAAAGDSTASSTTPTVRPGPSGNTKDAASKTAATTGIVLGAVGVALGAVALVVALVRGRRRSVNSGGSG
jgi:uncharacterized protein